MNITCETVDGWVPSIAPHKLVKPAARGAAAPAALGRKPAAVIVASRITPSRRCKPDFLPMRLPPCGIPVAADRGLAGALLPR